MCVVQVRTPNKRTLNDLERSEEIQAEEADDFLDDLALNPSNAPPSKVLQTLLGGHDILDFAGGC